MAITRELIQETGGQADPFALGMLAQAVLDNYPEFDEPAKGDYAYAVIFGILDDEYRGKDGVPSHLASDQIEDWLCGRAIRAGIAGQRAQDAWDQTTKGVNNG